MKTVLSKLEEILVGTGKCTSKKEFIEDALRALLRAKPELKRDVAIELYKKGEVSLSGAALICGLNIEDFKEVLKERDIKISVPSIPNQKQLKTNRVLKTFGLWAFQKPNLGIKK